MTAATCVEKQDQRGDIQRIEDQADQQLLSRQGALAEQLVDGQANDALEQYQWQAQPRDGQQVAGIEKPGVTEDGQDIHRRAAAHGEIRRAL